MNTLYRLRRGFTLVEMLVVVAIIAALIAILIPSINYVQQRANKASTQALLNSIATGLEKYYQDFQAYPPSQATLAPALAVSPAFDRASLMLSQGLTGYLGASVDGADGLGFRVRTGGNGNIYPPYVATGGTNWMIVPATSNNHQVFIDLWGHEILYYRAVPGMIGGQRRNITQVFGSLAGNTVPPDAGFAAYFVIGDNSVTATSASATTTFWPLIGGSANAISAGDAILGNNSFLLISAGSDGVYFTADDIAVGGK